MAPAAVANESGLPGPVRDALFANAASMRSVTLKWDLQRHSTRTIEALVKDLGSDRYDFYQPETGEVSLQAEMFHVRKKVYRNSPSSDDVSKFQVTENITSFDGEYYFRVNCGSFKDCCVFASNEEFKRITPEVLQRSGFQMRTREFPVSDILYPYWKDREYKYYLDIKKNYAVLQLDWLLPDGRLLCRIKNSDWTKLKSTDTWLPKKSSCQWYTWHYCPDRSFAEGLFNEDIIVTELTEEEQPHAKFSPDLDEPGLTVSDPRPYAKAKPGATWNKHFEAWNYTNPPDFAGLQPHKRSVFRTILVALNVVIFALLGWSFVRKRYAKRQG
jgi:hypothetical protein